MTDRDGEQVVQKLLALIVDLDPQARTCWSEVAAELRALAETWSRTSAVFSFYATAAAVAESKELEARRPTKVVMCAICHEVAAEVVVDKRAVCGKCAPVARSRRRS